MARSSSASSSSTVNIEQKRFIRFFDGVFNSTMEKHKKTTTVYSEIGVVAVLCTFHMFGFDFVGSPPNEIILPDPIKCPLSLMLKLEDVRYILGIKLRQLHNMDLNLKIQDGSGVKHFCCTNVDYSKDKHDIASKVNKWLHQEELLNNDTDTDEETESNIFEDSEEPMEQDEVK